MNAIIHTEAMTQTQRTTLENILRDRQEEKEDE